MHSMRDRDACHIQAIALPERPSRFDGEGRRQEVAPATFSLTISEGAEEDAGRSHSWDAEERHAALQVPVAQVWRKALRQ
ncbi:MAG: hypothetical protein ABIO22_02940 [Candidatus Saccharimonadales bacterium]